MEACGNRFERLTKKKYLKEEIKHYSIRYIPEDFELKF
jgi:hypothetical protein